MYPDIVQGLVSLLMAGMFNYLFAAVCELVYKPEAQVE